MAQEMFLRKIPEDMRPWECNVNGVKYVYPAGTEQNVPAEVAALIDAYWEKQEVDYPETGISFNDLRDRPFYSEVVESVDVEFEEQAITTVTNSSGKHTTRLYYNDTGLSTIKDNTHVIVVFDGELFDLRSNNNALGNKAAAGVAGAVDTGEPFYIATGSTITNIFTKTPGDHTIAITVYKEETVYHTIDPKFGTAFRVNVWYNGSAYVADKTCAEIREAERKKYPIVGTYTNKAGKVYTMIGCDGSIADLVRLAAFDVGSTDLVVYSIYIIEDGKVGVNVHSYAGINTDEV